MTSLVEPTSRPGTSIEHEDAIAEALRAFLCALGPAAADTRVAFGRGVATLSGAVASTAQRQAIEDLVSASDGVERVVNALGVSSQGVIATAP